MLLIDLIGKCDEREPELLGNIKAVLEERCAVLCLQARKLQHAAHEPGQPFRLRGDDLKIFLFRLRRDRPVENAVGKAGDRRHRRFELM